ncbi:heterodimeric geranylgeranyl pyrophosphate synthase small subunit, chloroplastic-like [Gastrolobium bilobum]|uniref:heterodimeric geranylgeranyl pyrophosphate synthase small subunit, chloroplastic-like n=1 Tax=Gastrolobium bilobum TaxID=150636 RepID=UPI002AAF455B|nr:heterodimeric geranylgeranyl pyrophosphate synthase small subunit, chloroplastic-like [Gastrolobium bilobum]
MVGAVLINGGKSTADIEAHLKQTIPMKEPLVVFEPMNHLVFASPRTTVPALCLAACEFVGGQRHQAMAAASALLLLQAATYTHEHLPLTDKPRPMLEPEPEPMIPRAFSPDIHLMTGDGIVPFGFELLARSDDPAQGNSERILRVIIEISRSVGSVGVIDAQYRKTQSDGRECRHVESIKRVVEKNEGGLHACGAACGAVLGSGSEEDIERLRKYGFYVGMIQGMLLNGLREEVEEARNLALIELQFFKDRDIDAISSFINV